MATATPLHSVVLFEDDQDVRAATVQALKLAGLQVSAFGSAGAVPERIGADFPGVVISDIRLPGRDGREIFRSIHRRAPVVPVILITGHAQVQDAVDLVREGAFDFLSKPFSSARLVESVRNALEQRATSLENQRLQGVDEDDCIPLIGSSARISSLRGTLKQVADTSLNVLVTGETGTGKGMVAKALHEASHRTHHPFIVLDCSSLTETLLEPELFGAETVVSGMTRRRPGRLEAAERGTLLLDNVDALSLGSQSRLLRAVEEKEITPVGGTQSRQLSCRIVATATRLPDPSVSQSNFRPELFYRLAEVTFALPPLRERREDITRLYIELMRRTAKQLRKPPIALTPAVRPHLLAHDWPGNLRELRHFTERLLLGLDATGHITEEREPLHVLVGRFEAETMKDALRAASGDVKTCIELLGIPRKTFYDKVARFGIDLESFRKVQSATK